MRIRNVVLLVAAIIAIGVAGCSHGGAAADDAAAKSDAAVAEVTVTKVGRAEIQQIVTVTGSVAALPNQDVRVSSLVPGRIAELRVAEGDTVKAGEVLAKIDERPLRDQLRQAEAAAEQAKASLENAKLNRARNETLVERGIAARKDVEDARTLESVAAATLRQSEAALALAQLQISRAEIVSPLNGMVAKRFVNVGEQVDGTNAQPVVEVANLGGSGVDRESSRELHGKNACGRHAFDYQRDAAGPNAERARGGDFAVRRSGHQFGRGAHPHRECGAPAADGNVFKRASSDRNAQERAGGSSAGDLSRRTGQGAGVSWSRETTRRRRTWNWGLKRKAAMKSLSGVKEGDTIILTGGYGLADKAKIKIKS